MSWRARTALQALDAEIVEDLPTREELQRVRAALGRGITSYYRSPWTQNDLGALLRAGGSTVRRWERLGFGGPGRCPVLLQALVAALRRDVLAGPCEELQDGLNAVRKIPPWSFWARLFAALADTP